MEFLNAIQLEVESKEINKRLAKIDNILDCCRVCMANKDTIDAMESIFDAESNNIVEKLQYCAGIEVTKDDGLPTHICTPCLTNLTIAHQFKLTCIIADTSFRKLLVKREVTSDDEYADIIQNDQDCIQDDDDDHDVKDEVLEMLSINSKKPKRMKKERLKNQESIDVKPKRKYNKTGNKRIKKMMYTRLQCDICNVKFDTKEESVKHDQELHKDSMCFICEVCGKYFQYRSSHYSHMKSHLPPQYSCTHCDYSTWHKHDLAKHLRRHTGVKMYQCEICSASYYTSSNLAGHIRRCHLKEKRFQCPQPQCDRSFYDKTKLNRHVDSHNDIKRHECEICHSCFTRRCYWKKHLLRQHGVVIPATRPGRRKTNYVVGEMASNIVPKTVLDALQI